MVCALMYSILFVPMDLFSKDNGGSDNAFSEGKMIISAGYGAPNLTKSLFKIYEGFLGFKLTGLGPIHAKFEYAVTDKIGLGVSLNYVQTQVEWTDSYLDNNLNSVDYALGFKGSSLSANARMNLHFGKSKKLDPYWGFGFGYRSNSYAFYSDYVGATPLVISGGIPLGFETTFGMRYYFTDNIGLYFEAGISKSILQGGLAIKI